MIHKTKILCIEDDRECATLLEEELLSRGYTVKVLRDFSCAYEVILSFIPDLILCDINVPGKSGLDFINEVREFIRGPKKIPFIFVTANGDKKSQIRGHASGANDYIIKPVDFDILDAIIVKYVGLHTEIEEPSLPFDITRRELEMLQWSAKGKTSAEIALIFGLSKRTVDFHINNVRLKLGVSTRTEAVVRASLLNLIEL